MSSAARGLSEIEGTPVPSADEMTIGIVVSEWNSEITGSLFRAASEALIQFGIQPENIYRHEVPGTFELPLGAQFLLEFTEVDAVICLGCVIQGETRHFDFICDAAAQGITNVGLKYNMPVIFGVLTPNDMQQAIDRSGGKHGNKGVEAAVTAVKMVALKKAVSQL